MGYVHCVVSSIVSLAFSARIVDLEGGLRSQWKICTGGTLMLDKFVQRQSVKRVKC